MANFYLYPVIEYRSDDPTWRMYRFRHTDNKDYLMAYSGGKLKEVYFVGEKIPNYFMSCRAENPYHISHYYVDKQNSTVRRYEEGEMNRIYYDDGTGCMRCNTHEYTQKFFNGEDVDILKIYSDLQNFLKLFQTTGIKIEKPEYVT